jgi:hypothetical protein
MSLYGRQGCRLPPTGGLCQLDGRKAKTSLPHTCIYEYDLLSVLLFLDPTIGCFREPASYVYCMTCVHVPIMCETLLCYFNLIGWSQPTTNGMEDDYCTLSLRLSLYA